MRDGLQHDIRLELTTQHNILGERYCSPMPQTLGPWSFLVTLLALQLKLFVMQITRQELERPRNLIQPVTQWPMEAEPPSTMDHFHLPE